MAASSPAPHRRHPASAPWSRQSGVAVLLMVAVLLLLLSLVAISTSRTGVAEQQITANDQRAREVQQAAEAGLAYGLAWVFQHHASLGYGSTVCPAHAAAAACPTSWPTLSGSGSGESYHFSLNFVRDAVGIRIVAEAVAVADGGIRARAESFALALGYPYPPGTLAAVPGTWKDF